MVASRNARHNVTAICNGAGAWSAWCVDVDGLEDLKVAHGETEDIAVSNWWALYALDEKHPRKDWKGYVAHE